MEERHFRIERFIFKNKGKKLIGAIWFPSDIKEPLPGILVLHGFPGMAPIINDVMYSLCQEGFAPMMIHYRGCWGSQGDYSFLGAIDDARKAFGNLTQRKEVDPSRIVLVGHSFGGLIATYLTAQESIVKAAIALCPVANIHEDPNATHRKLILERGLKFVSRLTAKKALKEWETLARKYDPVSFVSKISPRPYLLIHGDKDDIIPISSSKTVLSRAKDPKELFIVNNADHIFAGKRKAVIDKTIEWIKPILER